jgi:hypothetical protein
VDTTQRYRLNDLAKWVKLQVAQGAWNSEVHDAVLSKQINGDRAVIVVVMKDNKRLRVTVEAVE